MSTELKEYLTKKGEAILYRGNPDFDKLDQLSNGPGDIWHSSFEQGFKNAFPEIAYQTSVIFWYVDDFDNLDECVSWRVNPDMFAVRKSVWETIGGFDADFESTQAQALDFGFQALRFYGAVTLYAKGLFPSDAMRQIRISRKDRYTFFRKNFKMEHSIYMIYRRGIWNIFEWNAMRYAKKHFAQRDCNTIIPVRKLIETNDNPSVSYIIPTMLRQDFTLQLLEDLTSQAYKPSQVIIIDATPEGERNETSYTKKQYPFEVQVIWQQSKGSCRARNEAIEKCTSDYIVFGDDDIRIPPDFIQSHIRFLQTYNAFACNGLDIRADNFEQNLDDLQRKLDNFGPLRWRAGVTTNFSNANSCVKKEYVDILKGNDINFDGGYGEDSDFGLSLVKIGITVLFNPYATNLHLKPPAGGYRWWNTQAKILGKKRKKQPWELNNPVGIIRPVPSPTVVYGILKQFSPRQLQEYKHKNLSYYVFRGPKSRVLLRFLLLPYKIIQFNKSVFYAKKLISLGTRHK
jgi:glycosyltransferase involved in cell wall biosynthesis